MKDIQAESTNTESERQKLIDSSQFQGIHWFILMLSGILTFTAWYIATEQLNKSVSRTLRTTVIADH